MLFIPAHACTNKYPTPLHQSIDDSTPFHKIIVDTPASCKLKYLLGRLSTDQRPVLFVGTAGTVDGAKMVHPVLSTKGVHPVLFGFVRSAVSATALACAACCAAACGRGCSRSFRLLVWDDFWLLAAMSGCLFCGQFLELVGSRMASPDFASLWQPSQPVITMLLAIALRLERITVGRVAGVVIAVAGRIAPAVCP